MSDLDPVYSCYSATIASRLDDLVADYPRFPVSATASKAQTNKATDKQKR